MQSRREFFELLLAGTAALPTMSIGMSTNAFAQNRANVARIAWPYDTASLDAVGVGAQRSTWCVSLHIYDRLVTYETTDGPNGTRQYEPSKLKGELAEKWEMSPDNKKITFFIRPNAKFHDGSPVTAEDVRWSIERSLNVKGAAGVMAVGALTSADQLKVINDTTIEVSLPAPNRFAIAVFSIPFAAIINSKLAKKNATDQDPWANEWLKRNAAGGGAYKIEAFRNDQVALTRNEDWVSGPKPAMQQVVFQTVPEAATRGALVERGSADIAIEIPPNDFAAIAQRGTARALAIPMRNHMDFIAMNSRLAPFNDVRIRQAVAYALPYDEIFKSVFQGRGTPLYGGSPDALPSVFPQPSPFNYNPDKAKDLLKSAGSADGFEVSLIYSIAKAASFDPLSLAIRDALGKIGIKVNIERLPGAQFDEKTAARTAQMMLDNRVAWLSLPDYWFKAFYTGKQVSNMGNYANPKLEEMLAELPGDATPAVYAKATQQMAKLVLNDAPMIPIRQGAVELVMSKDLGGYTYWFHGLPDARDFRRV